MVTCVLMLVTACVAPASRAEAFDADRMREADRAIEAAIDQGTIPGAVLLVGFEGETVYHRAYGDRALEPEAEAMTRETVFDLASLSKPVACATSVMILADRGEVDLQEPVGTYLPEFSANGKGNITVEHLLLHRGGLRPANPMSDYEEGPSAALEKIYASAPASSPGVRFRYTDLGYIVLGKLVEAVDGRPLDRFAREEIFEPLGMSDTLFTPPADWADRIAPTEQRDGEWMRGQVHDPRAYALGGVAGHAGLFSTAEDLARYCEMLVRGGEHEGRRVLSEEAVGEMTSPHWTWDASAARSYGFDIDTGYSAVRGDRFAIGRTFGHTGFTGTSLWVDPEHEAYVILLTNPLHPDGRGGVNALRREVATVAAEAALGEPASYANVLTGIDVLKRDGYALLEGQRVALITNHTGRDLAGNRTIDLLLDAEAVELDKLLAPEHGLFGHLDERIEDTTDEQTGLMAYSLYGETRRPTAEMLEDIDTLVFDIQDIGTRFYTYISTMGYAMEEAAEHGIRFVVLDRPNPLTGERVAGPSADADKLRFVSYGPFPLMHGMTVGELAEMFNEEYDIGCELTVVEMEGWERSMWWDHTNLTWVDPSPNMRNLTQALVYPGIGMLERSNLSVGRGTDQPFEQFGAPWIDGPRLAARLNEAGMPGLRFVPIEFTPESSKFADRECEGVYLIVTDREAIRPVEAGYAIAWHLRDLFGEAFDVDSVLNLALNDEAHEAMLETDDPQRIPEVWQDSLEAFKQTREGHLLYE